ncbi:MAG: hypothetical protein WCI88_11540, partial [Chloroflexota bacterium]
MRCRDNLNHLIKETTMANEDKPKSIDTGGGAYFGGKVEVHGGSLIGGDQYNTNVIGQQGGVVNVGSGAGSQSGASKAELIQLMSSMRSLLDQAGLEDDTRQILQSDVQVVVNQLEKSQPKKELILPKLEAILKMLPTAAAAGEALQKMAPMAQQAYDQLAPLAQQALQTAQQIF